MSQNFTDDVYAAGHVAATDLQNMENNFAALKTNFSGAAAPSSPSALQWWADTTNNILKLRNEANSAWLEIYDFANNIILADIDAGIITAAMISDAARKPTLVTGQTIAPTTINATTINATTLTVNGGCPPYMVPPFMDATEDIIESSGVSPAAVRSGLVYINPSAATMQVVANMRNYTGGGYIVYAYFTVAGLQSNIVSTNSDVYANQTMSRDISSLSGWQAYTLYYYTNYAPVIYQVNGISSVIY